ncbi:cytoskeleton protein RodZ [Massilia aurea]|uniref:Cytoskeleton protein RodZ n=1 Tax=Massilia aurea TaxID=373040 RepID=A0A7W9X1I1_9BURK|nr:RodZ domain-containing protein [Massilia aurea]MBB6134746.1 cytoskeleton protein RodZ [Massilia aurea]
MNEQADQPAAPGNASGIPGKTLQSQRETMGWSVEQVADQLKLAPRQVLALEAGDYASLPSPAVTRGFVRAYAKLLRIDAAPLVSMIELNMPPEARAGAQSAMAAARREQKPAAFSETRFPINGKRRSLPLGWIAAVVVVAGAAVAAWQFNLIPSLNRDVESGDAMVLENPAAAVVAPGVATPAHEGLINPSVPLISVPSPSSQGTAPAGTPTTAPTTPTAPAAAPAAAPVTAPGTATPTPVAAAPAATAPASAAPAATGANTLVLNVRADSWIEVRPSGGGRPLISRLVKAGSTESVEVAGPVNLTVGVPGAVTATLRGANVPLPQQPGKTIARVALK